MKGLLARLQKSGRIYYYFSTSSKPRREVPLGPDYVLAVAKWAELTRSKDTKLPTFEALALRYEREHIPTLAARTQQVYRSDLKHLRRFFKAAPLNQIKPKHIGKLLDNFAQQPTTGNRLKRMFSGMFNLAKRWGYVEGVNPVDGIEGHTIKKVKRVVTTEAFNAVWKCASAPLRDAMDLAYLVAQRPADTLKMTENDIVGGELKVIQNKTDALLRISIEGELAVLMARITARKEACKLWSSSLIVNQEGKPFTKQMLRMHFAKAKEQAAKEHPALADSIAAFWFTKLRSKAATDVFNSRGARSASDLLGHVDERTTLVNYIEENGKLARPTR